MYRIVDRSEKSLNSYDYGYLSKWDIDTLVKVDGYVRKIDGGGASTQTQFFIGLDRISSGASKGLVSAYISGNVDETDDLRKLHVQVSGIATGTAGYEYIIILEYTKATD